MGGDLLTGWLNNQYAEDRQNAAQDFSAKQYATRYQTTVKDMQAAGLNPMLAYAQGVGNSPGGMVGSSNATPSLGSSYNQSTVASAQEANLRADTTNKKAQEQYIAAQTADAWASAAAKTKGLDLTAAMIDKTREEIKNIPEEGRRLRAVYINLAEQSALMAQQGQTEVARRANLEAATQKLRLENLISQADYDAIVSTGHIGRIAREIKPVSDIGADWLSPAKLVDKLLPNAVRGKSTTTRETGTSYDRQGNPSGGYSRERSTTER